MSKEQTPTTAEEWMEEMGLPTNRTVANIAEQYAQAKVLEALEREFSEVVIFDSGELTKGTDYFKTEVKPNYKL